MSIVKRKAGIRRVRPNELYVKRLAAQDAGCNLDIHCYAPARAKHMDFPVGQEEREESVVLGVDRAAEYSFFGPSVLLVCHLS